MLLHGLQTRLLSGPGSASAPPADAAAQFNGTTNKLSNPNALGQFNPVALSAVPDLAINFWFCYDSFPAGNLELLNVAGGTVGTDGWFVFRNPATGFLTMGSSDGTGYSTLGIPVVLSLSTWYFASLYWSNATGTPSYQASLSTCADLNVSSVSVAGRYINSADPQPFNMGGGKVGQVWSPVRLDKVGLWKRPSLSAPSETVIWNGGAGLTYPELLLSGQSSGCFAYYDLDESSNTLTWSDGTGANDATATGNVLSVPPHCRF